MSRNLWVVAAVVGIAATTGIARAVGDAFDGQIHGCIKVGTGLIRASEDATCNETELAVSWADSAVFERFTQPPAASWIQLTTWPERTTVATVALPAGNYVISSLVDARKLDGGGLLVCTTYTAPNWAATILHSRLGTDPGEVRRATVSGTGTAELPDSGTVELKCASKDAYGAAPMEVALADVTALRVGAVDSKASE